MARPDSRMQAVLGMIDAAAAPLDPEARLEFLEDLAEQLDFRVETLAHNLGYETQEPEESEDDADQEDDEP